MCASEKNGLYYANIVGNKLSDLQLLLIVSNIVIAQGQNIPFFHLRVVGDGQGFNCAYTYLFNDINDFTKPIEAQ